MKQRAKTKTSRNKNGRVSRNGSSTERSERLGQGAKNVMHRAGAQNRQESRWT